MARSLRRLEDIVCLAGLLGGGLALVVLMTLTGCNVVMRLCGRSLNSVYELAGYCGALAVAFSLAETQRTGGNVTVDLVFARLPARLRTAVQAVNSLACAAFFLVIAWQVADRGMTLRDAGELSETLKWPYHPLVYAVAGGFVMLALSLLAGAARVLLPVPAEPRPQGVA